MERHGCGSGADHLHPTVKDRQRREAVQRPVALLHPFVEHPPHVSPPANDHVRPELAEAVHHRQACPQSRTAGAAASPCIEEQDLYTRTSSP